MEKKKSNVIKISIGGHDKGNFIYFVRSRFQANPKPVYPADIGSELFKITKKILKDKKAKQ